MEFMNRKTKRVIQFRTVASGEQIEKGTWQNFGVNESILEQTFVDSYMNTYIYQKSSNHMFKICIIFIKSSSERELY